MPVFTDYSILTKKSFKKYGLIIGPGGHGFGCFSNLINNLDTEYSIVMTPMDDGGCTGRMQKYFKTAIQNISTWGDTSFNKEKNPLALGDLKNNIKVWLSSSLENEEDRIIVEQVFECRSLCVEDFKNNFYKLAQVFPFLKKYWTSFCLLAESYLDVLAKSQDAGEKTSFGNLLLQILYNQSANSREFFNELKANGMIPKNVNLYFLVDQQLTLRGITESGKVLYSEAELDVCQSDPVKIESYKLYDSNNQELTSEIIFRLNPELRDLFEKFKYIKKQDAIILFPPGSISNLFPVLNVFHDLIKSLNLPILWFTNAFIQGNEQTLEIQLQEMHKMLSGNGSPLIVLGASKNPLDFVSEEFKTLLKEAYLLENKIQIDQHEVAQMMKHYNETIVFLPILDMEKIVGAGVKYSPKQIENYINCIEKIWYILSLRHSNSDELLHRFIGVLKKMVPKEYRYKIYPELNSAKVINSEISGSHSLFALH